MKGGYNFSFPTLLHFPGELLLMTAPLGGQVFLESQCFPQPEHGTHIFVYLISRDKILTRSRMGLNEPLYEEFDVMLIFRYFLFSPPI